MSAAAKKAISKSVVTGLLGTAAAKRQIDVLKELAEIEQKKEK